MSLASFSVRKKVTITMLTLIIVLLGYISYTKLGVDLMPDLEFPTVSIVTPYKGASSKDIEEMVTKPIEGWISTVTNVKDVKSTSKEGLSVINVEFEWGTNLDFAAQDLRETIGMYEKFLPEDVSKPVVIKFDISQFPVLMYGIKGKRSLFDLKRIIEDEVTERLNRIDGVASAQVFSPEEREFQVLLKKDKLKKLSISPDRVLQILRAENLNQPAGYIEKGYTEYILRTVGEFKSMDMIKRIPVGYTKTGEIIRLSEIADIVDGKKDTRNIARVNEEPGLFFIITKSSGANAVIVANKVKKELEKIKKDLPSDIKFFVSMDQSEAITTIAKGTTSNVIVGGILVVFLIYLFLSNWRPTLTIIISIPLSIIATFISFYVAGYTLNFITLMGLGLGIGMLVDNSVVVIENIFRHLEDGENSEIASARGTDEVAMAITASTLTTVGVFFPMLFASGVVGKLAQALALSVSFALLSSLFVALTIVPMLTSVIFKGMSKEEIYSKTSKEKAFEKYKNIYEGWLKNALKHKRAVLISIIIIFFLSLSLLKFTGSEFMPATDRPLVLLKLKLPVGTSLSTTDKVAKEIEKKFTVRKDVVSVTTIVGLNERDEQGGASESFNPAGPHEAVFWVRLVPKEKRKLSALEMVEEVKKELPLYKGEKLEAVDLGQAMFGGSNFPVEVQVNGKDLNMLKRLSDIIEKNMHSIKGFSDIHSSYSEGRKEIHISIDREKAYKLGLTVYQIASTIHTYTLGKAYTKFKDKGEEYDIRVLLNKNDRKTIEDIKHFPIVTPQGKTVYLDDVAILEEGEGPLKIERENQVRKISIYANILGRDLGSVIGDLKSRLKPLEKNLPSGYFIEYGGQYEDMKSGFKDLMLAFLIAVLLVYMIMASQFENLLHPFVIMFTIPLAFIGVVLGIFIGGKPISIVVLMGLIILAGIAVNNGIVMIDYINQLRRGGMDDFSALIKGATTRLRPVLITATSTIFGMLPMVFTTSEGAEMRIPLGLTIVGGLTIATFLTLFIIPIIYSVFNKIKYKEI
jgi:HAE1 family hydrophobic/amphiphilic exporter-1